MTWLGTLNLQRAGVVKNNAVAALLREFECSILGIQELDLNAASNVSYVEDWRKLGFTCLLGSFDEMKSMYRVALLSRLPILQIQLDGVSSPSRFCAGVIDINLGNGLCDKLVVCAIYGSPEMKQALVNWSLRSSMLYLCFAVWIILGDVNLVQDEWALGALLSSGAAHSMDEPFGPNLPATCGRWIDYGLCSSCVHATAIDRSKVSP